MSADGKILELVEVSKTFGTLDVLENCNLRVAKGETIVLIGPSGSGKSTLLRCINMLEPPTEGSVLFEGREVSSDQRNANRLRREVGMVFQNFELFQHLSAIENIMLAPMRVLGMNRKDAHDLGLELLRKVHMPDRVDHFPDELSGGQQQRVAIARALAMRPKIMLYDEPTSALDPEMIREVLDVMTELSNEGMTTICVTHEMGFARRAADRIIFMEEGEILENAPTEEFFGGRANERAQKFLSQILH